MRMSVQAIDCQPACRRGSSPISCPVSRPPPRICVDLQSTTGSCCPSSCPPPDFPIREFPPPPVCPGWCVFLWFLFAAAILVIVLCILACLRGKDDKPRKHDKPSMCQRLHFYWQRVLFYIRCGLKRIFGKNCPSQCYMVILRAVTPIGRCIMCRSKDPEKACSENTKSTPIPKNQNNSNASSNATPVQLETSKAPTSPTTRTRRVEPSDEHCTDNTPTAV